MDWLDGGEDLLTAQRERDKPRQSLKNNTAGVREREDENRTREAGNLDEIQGAVARSLNLFRNGAVGFIDWLGAVRHNGINRGKGRPTAPLIGVLFGGIGGGAGRRVR